MAEIQKSGLNDNAQAYVPATEVEIVPVSEPETPKLPDEEWTECCCGYLQRQLEPRGSVFTRRWYSLQTGEKGGLQLIYSMAPPETEEPTESPTDSQLKRWKQMEE